MTLAVVVEARGLQGRRGDHRPGAADQRRRLGAGRQPAGRPGRGRHPQADDVPDHAQGGRPVRVPRPGRGRRPRADPGRQRRDGRGAGRPPADPRPVDRRRALAGGAVPPQRPACATSTSSSPPGSSTPIPAFASRATGRSRGCRTTPPSCASYDALLLVDPDMQALGPAVARDDHELRRPGRRRADLRRRRAATRSSSSRRPTPESAGGDWTRILPVVREPGLFRTEAEVRLSTPERRTRWN